MNEDHGLTRENLLCSLPIALSGDLKTAALARTIAGALAERREEIERLAIYPNTAKLEEGLLDILARDFKVDWWDSDYSVEEKRRTLATSWQVHKTLGTKAAVIKAITSVYPSAALEEWFEYGGEPYRFRLSVRLSENGWDASKHRQLLEKMQYYKNLRSHREAVMYYMPLVTVENPQRFLFESLLISGRFAPNIQRAERAGLIIPAEGWLEIPSGGATLDLPIEGVTGNMTPVVTLSAAALETASACELRETCETLPGAVRFWAGSAPGEEMSGELLLILPYGGTGGGAPAVTVATDSEVEEMLDAVFGGG